MLGKETKLLWRDRTFFVQTIVMPLFFIGFQFIVNPEMFQSGAEPRIAAVIAFGVGAYVLVFGAFSVLAVETRGLWLLYTFPHSLARLLRQKVWLWTGVASVYTTALLALTWRPDASSGAADWLGAPLAVLGIVLYAFLAAGMGVLGSDPLAQETSRKVRPEWSFLYMMLAAIFGFGISSEDLWIKLVLVCLSVLTAYALWEKVRDRLPLLLDPTQTPPPRITLADGLIAALVFFQVQALFAFLFVAVRGGAGAAAQLVLAYALSGVVTVLFALYIFWRTKVPDLFGALGLRRGDGEGPTPSVAQLWGVGWGVAAALFSFLYLLGLQRFFPHLLESPGLERDLGVGFVVLAVFLAPPFEEFIFRGLIYRGMRHGIGRTGAALASAAVFALVHPPVSFVPVFVLGVACAICFERTRLLIAPITAHVVYNAAQFLVAPQILQ
jgi:membrane protease YdiL (CAAX protease family)